MVECRRVVALAAALILSGCATIAPKHHEKPDDDGVFMRTGFESPVWPLEWGLWEIPRNTATVDADPARGFEPLKGRALRMRLEKGKNTGISDLAYYFAEDRKAQPEEIYLRYYLRFANDWETSSTGKLPGIAGTYEKGGWGGRKADGRNGWSARGGFRKADKQGRIPIGFYVYHMDQAAATGSFWVWDIEERGFLKRDRWYCIEQFVRLNTPGKRDGVLRGWVDGRLAFEKKDVRFRNTRDLRIERIWMDLYHGGPELAVKDHHLYIDELAIARKRIGMKF